MFHVITFINPLTYSELVEKSPDSKARQEVLKEEIEKAAAAKPEIKDDEELRKAAEKLLALLEAADQPTSGVIRINIGGSGAAAVGTGATAAGERAVIAKGDVSGGIITGDNSRINDAPDDGTQ